jgi:hypothetical protein
MPEPKIYCPKASAKEHVFRDGGSSIKLGFHAATLIEFVKAHTNEKGYINLLVSKRREVSQYGETHSISLDTFVPRQDGQRQSAAPSDQPTEAQRLLAERRAGGKPASAPAEDDPDRDVPF